MEQMTGWRNRRNGLSPYSHRIYNPGCYYRVSQNPSQRPRGRKGEVVCVRLPWSKPISAHMGPSFTADGHGGLELKYLPTFLEDWPGSSYRAALSALVISVLLASSDCDGLPAVPGVQMAYLVEAGVAKQGDKTNCCCVKTSKREGRVSQRD